jgi:hypothetical protein
MQSVSSMCRDAIPPYRANFALGAGAVAFADQHARERKPTHRTHRFTVHEAAHGGCNIAHIEGACRRSYTLSQPR